MLERLPQIEAEYEDVVARLSDPATLSDQRAVRDLSRRHKELEAVVRALRALRSATDDLETARQLQSESTGGERELAHEEAEAATRRIEELEAELRALLLPRDPNDGRNVIVEIRGAEGGEEANLFARDLFDMYLRYAATRGWKVEVMSEDASDRDGLNEAVFSVRGRDAWARLEHEGGPHRVQRVPVTESKGRV